MKALLCAMAFVLIAIPLAFALPLSGTKATPGSHFVLFGDAAAFASP